MVASAISNYEELRRQRLEENKKRMEELNLSKSLYAATPKPSPAKHRKPKSARKEVDLSPVRRSRRTAGKPRPDYKEGMRLMLSTGDLMNRVYASHEFRAVERAEQLESELGSEYPCFVKPMFQSHITGRFWLGLPQRFCKAHMPKEDEMITLEDEDGNESPTKYLANRIGLSGGWRGFALDHELVDGDALVFQLIRPAKFKVYIIRVNEHENGDESNEDVAYADVDDDVVLLKPVPKAKPRKVAKPSPGTRRSRRKKSTDVDEDVFLVEVLET
uniref:TF-B3 domain-containing protein n=1 Tax=Kalanchoe fedtschenkoi TaxID=63787 RepID=A0A7N0TCB6_KALFE